MQNDYECPRCHHVFPSSNKIMHDIRCTEQYPFSPNQTNMEITKKKEINKEIIPEIKESENENDNLKNKDDLFDNNSNENLFNNKYNKKDSNNNNNLIRQFPNKTFLCEKCNLTFLERDRNEHMLCHKLEEEEEEKEDRWIEEQQKKMKEEFEKKNRISRHNNNNNSNNNFRPNLNNRNINNINNNSNIPVNQNRRDQYRNKIRNDLIRMKQEFLRKEAEDSDYGPFLLKKNMKKMMMMMTMMKTI